MLPAFESECLRVICLNSQKPFCVIVDRILFGVYQTPFKTGNQRASVVCRTATCLCSVVWEKLDQIDGDTEYVDSNFTRSSRCTPSDGLASPLTGNQHE